MAEQLLGGSYKLVNGERVRDESRTQTRPQGVNETATEASPTNDEVTIEEIQSVIPLVPEQDYTLSNKPRVEAIEALLGKDITEEQRDTAWYDLQVDEES